MIKQKDEGRAGELLQWSGHRWSRMVRFVYRIRGRITNVSVGIASGKKANWINARAQIKRRQRSCVKTEIRLLRDRYQLNNPRTFRYARRIVRHWNFIFSALCDVFIWEWHRVKYNVVSERTVIKIPKNDCRFEDVRYSWRLQSCGLQS